MKMLRAFIVLICITLVNPLIAQTNANIYSGGTCFEGDLCGYWILKNNSTFIYTNFDSLGLRSFGFGSWKISENKLFVKFDSLGNYIKPLMNYSIKIKSTSDYINKDSIRIKVSVVDKSNALIRNVSVIINRNIYGIDDSAGNTFFVLPRDFSISMIRLKSLFFKGTPIITIPINENNNHEILVVIDNNNSNYTELINDRFKTYLSDFEEKVGLNFQFRIIKPKEGRIHHFSVSKSEDNIEIILNKLKLAQKLQAQNYSSINQIISMINQ